MVNTKLDNSFAAAIEMMQGAIASMPTPLLDRLMKIVSEERQRRRQENSPGAIRVDLTVEFFLSIPEQRPGATVEVDVHGTLASLKANAETLATRLTDHALLDAVDRFHAWLDITELSIKELFVNGISGLVARALRAERDRRLIGSVGNGSR